MSLDFRHTAESELLDAFIRGRQTVLNSLTAYDSRKDPGELDYLIYQVTKLYRLAKFMSTCTDELLQTIATSLSIFEELQQNSGMMVQGASFERSAGAVPDHSGRYVAQQVMDDRVGRPRLNIPKDQLEYLLVMGFSGPEISNAVGVSLSTIRRRMTEYGLSVGSLYSDLTDQELDSIVCQIKVLFPNCGFRMMQGHLLNQGHRVAQTRIRESLQRIDPDGVAIRWSATIERRTYRVQSPLSLWHVDGNHKLIRWKMVVHAAVDGYSRIPVYLHCSNNNRAETVLNLFKEAVQNFGLPSRVRCDQGGENVDVSMFMLSHPLRGPNRGSVLVGRSVHNQRVERMWRDVFQGVTGLYYSLFHYLEGINILDVDNDLHTFCLHYVFIPRINRHLEMWRQAWIKHPLSSERSMTPEQLWTFGLQNIACSNNHIAKEVFEDLAEDEREHYGIDWDGPVPYDDTDDYDSVVVPEIECPLIESHLDELDDEISPLANTTNYGIDLYEKTLDFVSSKLNVLL